MDINNTFLQAILNKVYVTQPEGFINTTQPSFICHLKKALYSLKQAPLAWNHTLNMFLINLSFTATTADPCIYSYHNNDDDPYNARLHHTYLLDNSQHQIFLSIYINNLLIIRHINNVNYIKQKLRPQSQLSTTPHSEPLHKRKH
ncbi:polyprotein [Acanthamoeba castellanii str. Neff]|uniref:Polyprotein n=1 Tax=Acanthamoeba castellanii (strain ATCC 30010 / Neff) TaxID=1257118 RepID=L8GQY3_ACACF|nr:polyprotein [Acanthamoeba castellanii str. Neff]ELR14536.1 polyprotein [Acanthamoeba castellanii str. Neff]